MAEDSYLAAQITGAKEIPNSYPRHFASPKYHRTRRDIFLMPAAGFECSAVQCGVEGMMDGAAEFR